MKRSKLGFFAACALLAGATAACSDDASTTTSSGGSGTPSTSDIPAGFKLSCSASTTLGPIDYVVNGSSLDISVGTQTATLTREASGSGDRSLYGTWALPPATYTGDPALIAKAQLSSHATFKIEDGRVTVTNTCSSKWAKITVSVTSPATITDTSFESLEAHSDSREWTSSGGERIVSKMSVPFGGEAPRGGDPALTFTSVAALPFAAR